MPANVPVSQALSRVLFAAGVLISTISLPVASHGYTMATGVSPMGCGSVTRSPDLANYSPGVSVTLTAVPQAGFQFLKWTGDATGTTNPLSVTMDGSKRVIANYTTTSGTSLLALFPDLAVLGGDGPAALQVADVNHDGRPDIVTADRNGSTISLVLWQYGESHADAVAYPTGADPYRLILADLNADGWADAVTANRLDNSVSVLINDKLGGFEPRQDYATGSDPRGLVVVDINSDGRPDIVTANYGGKSLSKLLQNVDHTFATPTTTNLSPLVPEDLAAANVDGDAAVDFIVGVAWTSSSTPAIVVKGNGAGTVQVSSSGFGSSGATKRVVVADVNGDNKPELFASGWGHGGVNVLPGLGGGVFGAPTLYAAGDVDESEAWGASDIKIVDLDGDAGLDMVVGGAFGTEVSVWHGSGGVFTDRKILPTGLGIETFFIDQRYAPAVATADFDGDGRLDLAAANFDDDEVSVLLGWGNGSFGRNEIPFAASPASQLFALGHLDGDSDMDIAVEGNECSQMGFCGNSDLFAFPGNGDGTFGSQANFTVDGLGTGITLGRFTGDALDDLVLSTSGNFGGGPYQLITFPGDGAGGFLAPISTQVSSSGSYGLAAGNWNGDVNRDVVLGGTVWLGNGDGTFTGPGPTVLSGNNYGVADFDRDGIVDLVTAATSSHAVGVMLGNGDGSFDAPAYFGTDSNPVWVIAAHLNADAYEDLVTANGSSVSVLLGNGDGTFGTKIDLAVPVRPNRVAAADLNGDGHADIACGGTLVSVFEGHGDGTFSRRSDYEPFSRAGFEAQLSDLEIADLDGDARPDLFVALGTPASTHNTTRAHMYILHNLGPAVSTATPLPEHEVLETAISGLIPNPSVGVMRVDFAVARTGRMQLEVLDVAGRVVARLVDGVREPGRYSVKWNGQAAGNRAAPGLYFVRLRAADRTVVRKLAMTR